MQLLKHLSGLEISIDTTGKVYLHVPQSSYVSGLEISIDTTGKVYIPQSSYVSGLEISIDTTGKVYLPQSSSSALQPGVFNVTMSVTSGTVVKTAVRFTVITGKPQL